MSPLSVELLGDIMPLFLEFRHTTGKLIGTAGRNFSEYAGITEVGIDRIDKMW